MRDSNVIGPMQIIPGDRIGCFVLGMGINDALSLIRQNFIPQRPKVDVVYTQHKPLEKDILLRIEDFGLQLRFEPVSQRLRMMDVLDLSKLTLLYQNEPVKYTFLSIYNTFGPTYPGSFEEDLGVYVLRYQGVCFMFELPKDAQEIYSQGNELPIELPDGISPTACRVMVYSGFDERNPALVVNPKPPCREEHAAWPWKDLALTTFDPWYLEEVCIKISSGSGAPSTLQFLRRGKSLEIGSSVQDVISQLGSPSRVFFKHDNRMRIHSTKSERVAPVTQRMQFPVPLKGPADPSLTPIPVISALKERDAQNCFQPTDYFYNYFDCGFDLLFDGTKHRLKKFIAHSNFPGHSEFSQYNKCEFRVVFKPSKKSDGASGSGSGKTPSSIIILPSMRWSDVEALLGSCGRPMIHDSGVVANPFGATYLYAYKGCVFQVLRSGHIAGVTVF